MAKNSVKATPPPAYRGGTLEEEMEWAEESGEYADCIRAAIRNVIDNPDAERWWLEKFLLPIDVRVAEAWEMAGLVLTVAASAAQSKLTEYYQRKVAEQVTLGEKESGVNTGSGSWRRRHQELEKNSIGILMILMAVLMLRGKIHLSVILSTCRVE